jgi:hypothetical protein
MQYQLSCIPYDTISRLPNLQCNYENYDVSENEIENFNDNGNQLSVAQAFYHNLKCALSNAHNRTKELLYECRISDRIVSDFESNSNNSQYDVNFNYYEDNNNETTPINQLTNCAVNDKLQLIINNLVNPVSEFFIKLPKLFIFDNWNSSSTANHTTSYLNLNDCDMSNQILINCTNYNNNNDSLVSFSLFNNPIQCILELSNLQLTTNVSPTINSTMDNISYHFNQNNAIVQDYATTIYDDSIFNQKEEAHYEWSFLFVILFILAGGLGNILVCLAIALDRKLQNVTNYFLLSLAVADLLVSLFVMPLGAVPGFLGEFFFFS